MKKLKKLTALLLSASFLCSCASGVQAPAQTQPSETAAESVSENVSESKAETAAPETSASETTEAAEADESDEPITEYGIANGVLVLNSEQKLYLPLTAIADRVQMPNEAIPINLKYTFDKDLGSVTIDNWNFCRESTRIVGRDGVVKSVSNAKTGMSIESPYNIEYYAPKLILGKPEWNGLSFNTPLKSASFGCSVKGVGIDPLYVTAFVRKNGNTAEIIIDPAFLRGIPVYEKKGEQLEFDINGEKVYMDSFIAVADISKSSSIQSALSEKFSYAQITLDSLEIKYDIGSGYDCTAALRSVKVITEDTGAAISGRFVDLDLIAEGKNPKMSEVYNAIVSSLDDIYADDTCGVVLLDMDFDGMPEVLVSHYKQYEDAKYDWQKMGYAADNVDIFRISDDKLKYIDTIPIAHNLIDSISAYLGLKKLEDGSKAWFATVIDQSALEQLPDNDKNKAFTDCLFTLDGDKLTKTEVFRIGDFSDTVDENGNVTPGYFYYYGEKIVPEIEYYELTEEEKQEPYAFECSYNWNGRKAYFGTWELYGFLRRDYWNTDIEENYLLYSDWLITFSSVYEEGYGGITSSNMLRKELSERDMVYELAYLVDAYYIGAYNPAKKAYYYEFLGAYAKPVIYLYPEQETDVSVQVSFSDGGEVTCSYPEYNGGWQVKASPDGTLYDSDGSEYYCLYWEGVGGTAYDCSSGFCVSGGDTASFLREKLLYIGLTPREANEFIIYWLPIMQKNPYNIITFHTDDYAASVPLNVSPAPDTSIRVFMTFTPSETPVDIPPQQLPHYTRSGFTLVEWGGGER